MKAHEVEMGRFVEVKEEIKTGWLRIQDITAGKDFREQGANPFVLSSKDPGPPVV